MCWPAARDPDLDFDWIFQSCRARRASLLKGSAGEKFGARTPVKPCQVCARARVKFTCVLNEGNRTDDAKQCERHRNTAQHQGAIRQTKTSKYHSSATTLTLLWSLAAGLC